MTYPTKRIIYNEADGMARVLLPGDPDKTGLTVQQIAEKDVPKGLPFKIIEKADLPRHSDGTQDRDFREAWVADVSSPDGTGTQE